MLCLTTDPNYCFDLLSVVDLGFQLDLSDAVVGFDLHYWHYTLDKIVDSYVKQVGLVA